MSLDLSVSLGGGLRPRNFALEPSRCGSAHLHLVPQNFALEPSRCGSAHLHLVCPWNADDDHSGRGEDRRLSVVHGVKRVCAVADVAARRQGSCVVSLPLLALFHEGLADLLGSLLSLQDIGRLCSSSGGLCAGVDMRAMVQAWVEAQNDAPGNAWVSGWPSAVAFAIRPSPVVCVGVALRVALRRALDSPWDPLPTQTAFGDRRKSWLRFPPGCEVLAPLVPSAMLRYSLSGLCLPGSIFEGVVMGSFALNALLESLEVDGFAPGGVDVFLCRRAEVDLQAAGFGCALDHFPPSPELSAIMGLLLPVAMQYWNCRVHSNLRFSTSFESYRGWEYLLNRELLNRELPFQCSAYGMLEVVRCQSPRRWIAILRSELRLVKKDARRLRSALLVAASAFHVHRVVYPVLEFIVRLGRMGLRPRVYAMDARMREMVTRLVLPGALDPRRFDEAAFLLWSAMVMRDWRDNADGYAHPAEAHALDSLFEAPTGRPDLADTRNVVTFVVPELPVRSFHFVLVAPCKRRMDSLVGVLDSFISSAHGALIPPPVGAVPLGLSLVRSGFLCDVMSLTCYPAGAIAQSFDMTVCMVGARVSRGSAVAVGPCTGVPLTDELVARHVCDRQLHIPVERSPPAHLRLVAMLTKNRRVAKYVRRGFDDSTRLDTLNPHRMMHDLFGGYAPAWLLRRNMSARSRLTKAAGTFVLNCSRRSRLTKALRGRLPFQCLTRSEDDLLHSVDFSRFRTARFVLEHWMLSPRNNAFLLQTLAPVGGRALECDFSSPRVRRRVVVSFSRPVSVERVAIGRRPSYASGCFAEGGAGGDAGSGAGATEHERLQHQLATPGGDWDAYVDAHVDTQLAIEREAHDEAAGSWLSEGRGAPQGQMDLPGGSDVEGQMDLLD